MRVPSLPPASAGAIALRIFVALSLALPIALLATAAWPCLPFVLVLIMIRFLHEAIFGKTSGGVSGAYGTAAWATHDQLREAGLFDGEGVILGRATPQGVSFGKALWLLFTAPLADSRRVNQYFFTAASFGLLKLYSEIPPLIQLREYVHLLTVAPSGSGKGVGVIIPNLLHHRGPVVVIDPKGENYKLTAGYRAAKFGHMIACLDPFGVTEAATAQLNPLDLIDPTGEQAVDDARALAEALVVKSDKDQDPHWNEQATLLLQAVILFVVSTLRSSQRNLNSVREILANPDALRKVIQAMRSSQAAGGIFARLGGQLAGMTERDFAYVVSSANRHTNFLDTPRVAASVGHSSFRPHNLRSGQLSIYLVLPAKYLRSHSRLMRLWVVTLLRVLMDEPDEKNKVLFLLDEVAQLGEMQPLEDAVTMLRGYGLRLWFFLQSIDQLQVCFSKERAKVLISNFGVKQFFGITDIQTGEFVANAVGKTTCYTHDRTQGESHTSLTWGDILFSQNLANFTTTSSSTTTREVERDLIRPEEVTRLPAFVSIIFIHQRNQVLNPILAHRLEYFNEPEFAGLPEEYPPECCRPKPSTVSLPAGSTASAASREIAKAGEGRVIHFTCPNPKCGSRFKIGSQHSGRVIKCPECTAALRVPSESDL